MRKNLLLIVPLLLLASFLIAQTDAPSLSVQPTEHKDVFKKSDLKIYPNPAFNEIGLSNISNVSTIIIYNLVGRKMKRFAAAKGKTYDIADLPKGMYLVQLLGNDGKVVTTQRMSKR